MKMWSLKYSTSFICAVFIAIGAASGEEVKNVYGVVGGTVSFGPTSINPSASSIIWKHKNINNVVVKAIEWDSDDDSVTILNPRFKVITTLDKTTGNITISKLNKDHTGLYTIDIGSKEQEQRFKLEILPPVPKPKIQIERTDTDSNAVYLICEYSETIVWKNSAGDTLNVQKHHTIGTFITVIKNGNPDVYYTCTLKNEASEETSDPVYRRDLFEDSVPWWITLIVVIVGIVLIPIFIVILLVVLYKFWPWFHEYVNNNLKDKPHIGGILDFLNGNKKNGDKPERAADSSVPLRVDNDGGEKDDKL